MINSVRNTVLSVLNKNNYGYLSPSDFNLYAKQAQLEIFHSYFMQYNDFINKENARLSGTGHANMSEQVEATIESLSTSKGLPNVLNSYSVPSASTTGSDYYKISNILIYKTLWSSGTSTSTAVGLNQIIDTSATFITDGVTAKDIVAISNNGIKYAKVLSVDGETTITISTTDASVSSLPYAVYSSIPSQSEAEKVSHSKIVKLNKSTLTSPTATYPAYSLEESSLSLYPEEIENTGQVVAQYIRYPKDPKWTYVSLFGGEPSFDQSQSDFQDFELPMEAEEQVILKILQYSGLSLREYQIYQAAQTEEQENNQENK